MKKEQRRWSREDKERILLDVQRLGVVAGCRKHEIAKSLYYDWLKRYEAMGLEGLEDRRGKDVGKALKSLEKENQILKELLAEKELQMRMKDELLKKKIAQWNSANKSSGTS